MWHSQEDFYQNSTLVWSEDSLTFPELTTTEKNKATVKSIWNYVIIETYIWETKMDTLGKPKALGTVSSILWDQNLEPYDELSKK